MSMIKVENLTFAYPTSYDNIFEQVTVQMDTDWKIGFVGRNGKGKTTFLKLLLGNYEYRGQILASTAFTYFPYQVADRSRLTGEILEEVCPQAEDWERMREFSYLGVDAGVLDRPFQTLSPGEQTKVLLAALFLNEGHFLLIDEPTNHLDLAAREMVAAYLKKKRGFLLVSHDRHFLDGCVDHILSLDRTGCFSVQNGNFSSWMENFERQQQSELAQKERLQKDIKRLQQSARRASDWSERVESSKYGVQSSGLKADRGYVGHKAAKMMKRSKAIEARKNQAVEQTAQLLKNFETAEPLKLSPLTYHSDLLISCSETAVCYGGKPVSKPVSFTVRQGERVVLDGCNGSGKSSLLKLFAGAPVQYTGTVTIASGLVISYVPQDTSGLSGSVSEFARQSGIEPCFFQAILRKMDFERVQFEKDMGSFSDGQKKKVWIAKSLCESAHLYVWDEPLNFIDLYSRMQIEQLIREFSPTMLLVEHDRVFRDTTATKRISLSDGSSLY